MLDKDLLSPVLFNFATDEIMDDAVGDLRDLDVHWVGG